MKYNWLHRYESDKLILFFNGWGCDAHPFGHMQGEDYNVLMFYDYKELHLSEDMLTIIKSYKQVHVVAWSFGVWVAQCVLTPLKPSLTSAIAVNGTGQPVSHQHGIPEPIALGTLSGLNGLKLRKFQRRMLNSIASWQQFEVIKPQREIEEVKNELYLLLQHFKVQKLSEDFYDCAVIGTDDLIMPVKNQLAYWTGRANVIEVQQPHFCFFEFNNWTDLINLSLVKCK